MKMSDFELLKRYQKEIVDDLHNDLCKRKDK